MFRNLVITAFVSSVLFLYCRSFSHAQDTTIGGHINLTLYDYKDGESDGRKGYEYTGMGLREFILYLSSEVSDKISVDIQPVFNTETGATPRFGKDLGETKKSAGTIDPKFAGWRKAVVTILLPREYELSAGMVKPRFTWEYGAELFWEDEHIGGKFAINDYLGAMHETGIELYKPFELGAVSLPSYLYVLNGGSNEYADNNNGPLVMLHAEPETGALKFQGSFAAGKHDDKNKHTVYRYSAGVAWEGSAFSARAEYAGGTWEKSIEGVKDAVANGYYAKVFYRFTPWGRAMLHYDFADMNFNDMNYTKRGGEEYTTITPGIKINVAPSSALQIQCDIADWKRVDGSGRKLKFTRFAAGWRVTF